jgi:MinD-like ATPase involved in chromosome partitioning or flagellar assembly
VPDQDQDWQRVSLSTTPPSAEPTSTAAPPAAERVPSADAARATAGTEPSPPADAARAVAPTVEPGPAHDAGARSPKTEAAAPEVSADTAPTPETTATTGTATATAADSASPRSEAPTVQIRVPPKAARPQRSPFDPPDPVPAPAPAPPPVPVPAPAPAPPPVPVPGHAPADAAPLPAPAAAVPIPLPAPAAAAPSPPPAPRHMPLLPPPARAPQAPAPQAPAPQAPAPQAQQPTPLPAPVPTPVPALVPAAEALRAARTRRGESVAQQARRTFRRLVPSSAAQRTEEENRVAAELRQPIRTGRQIVITSVRGGAGKSTVAALLGLAFARYRPDPVLIMEADPALGTLPVRLGAPTLRWTVEDLAAVVGPQMRFDQVIGYLVGLPEGGWLLPGSRGQIGAQVSLDSYQKVIVALRRFFAVTVVDCETLPGELARSAMSAAQARVLVAPATVEGVTSARPILEWMAGMPRPMLNGTVVALVSTSPDAALDLDEAARYLRVAEGVSVMAVPYDRHLAAGGAIRMPALDQGTRDCATRLASDILGRAIRATR